jgi:hypothetical protein
MINLIQEHTIKVYKLDNEAFNIEKVDANTLLDVTRFDIFAKIAYIKYKETNFELAKEIYYEHIKAFNPDFKEPGRDDKNNFDDFINTFNELINTLRKNNFDDKTSIVPVDKNNKILDGAHRISILSYFDKKVTIAKFLNVSSKSIFDYKYFLSRGLPIEIADKIAHEAVLYKKNILVACLWPRLGGNNNRVKAIELIQSKYKILYQREYNIGLEGLTKFIYEVYKAQNWVGNVKNDFAGARDKAINCYSKPSILQFVFFEANDLNEVLLVKDKIREKFNLGKHAIHITDNHFETLDIANIIFDTNFRNDYLNVYSRFVDYIKEKYLLFKNVYLLNFKVYLARLFNKLKRYKDE